MRCGGVRQVLAAGLVALALAATGCIDGDGDDEAAPSTTEVESSTTAATAGGEEGATVAFGHTRVWVASVLPLLPMDWEVIDLDTGGEQTWLISLVRQGDQDVATALAWEQPAGSPTVIQWRSTDGRTWERSGTVLDGASITFVAPAGDRLVALGNRWSDTGPGEPLLWIDEGQGWEERSLGLGPGPDTWVNLYGVAATDAGLVAAGDRQRIDPAVPVVVSVGGYRVEIDDLAGTYRLTEEVTGRVVTSGPTTDIYRYGESGQLLHDPDTGEVLAEVPWEVWTELYPSSTPLPLVLPAGSGDGSASIEYEGFTVTVDEAAGTYEIVDSGGRTISGALEELYRGPQPRFTDPATGVVVLTVAWEEWDRLLDEFWSSRYQTHEPHDTETLVLFSPDGVEWEAQTLSLAPNTHLESVTAVDDRFVISVIEHGDVGANRTAWVSTDGRSWENVGTTGPENLGQVVTRPGGLVGIAIAAERPGVVTSSDGLSWQEELSIQVQPDGRDAWIERVGAGPLGVVATGTLYGGAEIQALTITIGGRTARFGWESAVEITDDATGEVLVDLSWDQVENPVGEPPVTYAEGVTTFYDGRGRVVMTIPDADVNAAYEAQSEAIEQQIEKVLFIQTAADAVWFEATPATGLEPGSDEQILVGEDRIVIGRMVFEDGDPESEPSRIQLVVGTLR
jgi:hypothetical protein